MRALRGGPQSGEQRLAKANHLKMKVLIAGAGIGGLTAALCLLERGIEVQIFEQSKVLGEVGAGIQLPPNAIKVFETLGVSAALQKRAFAPIALEARLGEDGRKIFSVPIDTKRWGGPYLTIHRADYIDVLKSKVLERSPRSLNLNTKIVSFESSKSGVQLLTSNRKIINGDVLIGADGIRSAVREQMFGADQPRFTGNVAWRAVVPASALEASPRPTSCAWFGRGKHAVTYPLRGGELVNFVGVVEQENPLKEGWRERGDITGLKADFEGWDSYLTEVINSISLEALFRWGLYDRAPFESWTTGHAALLGDAAHPMLPFMAQGAAMAVEDGWVLADELSHSENIGAALSRYEARRKPRASMVQAASRVNMRTFHQRSTLGQIMTYGPMWLAGSYAPSIIRKRLDKFYGYDVTGNQS